MNNRWQLNNTHAHLYVAKLQQDMYIPTLPDRGIGSPCRATDQPLRTNCWTTGWPPLAVRQACGQLKLENQKGREYDLSIVQYKQPLTRAAVLSGPDGVRSST
jgi:hypothetical protein